MFTLDNPSHVALVFRYFDSKEAVEAARWRMIKGGVIDVIKVEVGRSYISKFGLIYEVFEIKEGGWCRCRRLEDGKEVEVQESSLLREETKKGE